MYLVQPPNLSGLTSHCIWLNQCPHSNVTGQLLENIGLFLLFGNDK